MQIETLELPSPDDLKEHIINALSRYWLNCPELIESLPVSRSKFQPKLNDTLKLVEIHMPKWAEPWSADGVLLIPEELLPSHSDKNYSQIWKEVDWFLAIFLLLECWHERLWEYRNGPIHSYSLRLNNWDYRIWDKAWVNRIALFLREWVIQTNGQEAEISLGPLPKPSIWMTHDVDAVQKTLAIRIKQSAFSAFNTLKNLTKLDRKNVIISFQKTFSMLFGREDWWTFEDLLALEKNAEVKSIFHFYADRRNKNLSRWLFDPFYSIEKVRIKKLFDRIHSDGHEIGLHPTFDSWDNSNLIKEQKKYLESSCEQKVQVCRQHWLRFSWRTTWLEQSKAGISTDTTLMFNDRPGFRASCALQWRPWNVEKQKNHQIDARASVIMDSHFYDYKQFTPYQRKTEFKKWLQECILVYGQVAVLWHPHTLTKEYGWRDGFCSLLDTINELVDA